MEQTEHLDAKIAALLRAGTAHVLEARSGVVAEDLHQFLYLQTERASAEQMTRQADLVNFLEGFNLLRTATFKSVQSKTAAFQEVYGLMCNGALRSPG